MASASAFQDEFNCSICLDLLKDPVTVPCGHSFCLNCITGCWDQEDHKGAYSCPQCRETFTPRPVLRKNTMMADVLEKLKKTSLQPAAVAPSFAGPDDAECDLCTGRKHKAIKSCLTCLISYCEDHIQPHYDVAPLRRHKLVNATSQLQERICSQHDRIIELFCRTDEKLICMLCSMDDHSGHKTVSAAAERIEKQNKLVEMRRVNQSQIKQMEQEVEEVKQAVNSLQASAQKAVEDTERIFTKLISFMEKKRSEVTESIRAQERAEVSRAEGLLEQLEQEIAELKNRDAEMEHFQPIDDPIDFLQSFESQFASSVSKTLPKVTFTPQFSFSEVMKSVSLSLKEKTKEFHQEILKVTGFMTGDTVKLKNPETIQMTCRYTGGPFRFWESRAFSSSQSSFQDQNSKFQLSNQSSCGYDHNYSIMVNSVGVVTAVTEPDTLAVDFPERSGWKESSSNLDLVFVIN